MHLPTDEGKTRSKLDQELGDVFDERILRWPALQPLSQALGNRRNVGEHFRVPKRLDAS
jgi:hypothetical protein